MKKTGHIHKFGVSCNVCCKNNIEKHMESRDYPHNKVGPKNRVVWHPSLRNKK